MKSPITMSTVDSEEGGNSFQLGAATSLVSHDYTMFLWFAKFIAELGLLIAFLPWELA